MVRKDLQLAGLKVNLVFVEFNNMIDKTSNTYDWDVVAFSLGGITDPHFGKSSAVYSSERYVINPGRKTPSTPWEGRIAEIFEQGVSEMDKAKRKALYDEWQMIVMQQCTHVYMPLRQVILGVNDRIGNIHLTRNLAQGQDMFHNVAQLYILDKGTTR